MTKKAQERSTVDPFAAARAQFEELVKFISGKKCPEHHAEIEAAIDERGREVHRLVLQGRLDQLHAAEAERLRRRPPRGRVRVRKRQLESRFGRVVVRRHGVRKTGADASRFTLDERLGLPREIYSLGLRRLVAEEVRAQSWDQAVARIDAMTGGHVPKRQAEELAVRAAQDFDAFYAERNWAEPANDTANSATLLVLSCDGKGVAMRPDALRDATRKQAEEAQREDVRGDPTEVRAQRRHTKRMAIVTAVWDQEPCPRTADDIVRKLRKEDEAEARALPRPTHKRVAASVEKSLAEGVAEVFDEADRRDPTHERPAVALIDGNEYQAEVVEQEAAKRGREITVVLDLLHALHYIWLAGMAVRRGDRNLVEAWMRHYLYKLLTAGMPHDVIAGIRQAATLARLSEKEREPVEKCASYLETNIGAIRYREFLAAGLPIATGVIEGACRHLVQDRLGITGARWGLDSAEAVLRLRALNTNGDWDEYCRYHLRKEHERRSSCAAA
jgi:hypothetical protein